jgi:serine/threonine-protein kinase
MAVTDLVQEDSVVGAYHILNKIGEGHGVVYRATQVGSSVDLAVKFTEPISSESGYHLRPMVQTERNVHTILGSHPRIAGIVDAFEVYVNNPQQGAEKEVELMVNVYEYVPAISAKDLLSRTQGVKELIIIGHDITKALVHVHDKTIVHRDMKPGNILVDKNTGRAKLSDFGVAALATELHSQHNSEGYKPPGTPVYMSPEQICGEEIGYPSDIYSFGAVMHDMLTGYTPVEGKTTEDFKANLQADRIVTTYGLRTDIPKELKWALEDLEGLIMRLRVHDITPRPDAKETLTWFQVLEHDLELAA